MSLKISACPAATSLAPADLIPAVVVANGPSGTSKITVANLILTIAATASTWTGVQSHPDNKFFIVGSADATKKVAFEVDGLTTATTRTLTVPNASMLLAGQDYANTWTAQNVFNASTLNVPNVQIDGGAAAGALPTPIASRCVLQIGSLNSTNVEIESIAYGTSAAASMSWRGRAVGGTRAVPAATRAGQLFFQWTANGHDGTAFQSNAAQLFCEAASLWSATDRSTQWRFAGTSTGSTTITDWARLRDAGLIVGTSTALIGGERARFNGGTISTPTSADVCIGGGAVAIGSTTASTSNTTGALTVAGDVGANGFWAGARITRGAANLVTYARVSDPQIQTMSSSQNGGSIGLTVYSTTASAGPIILLAHSPDALNSFATVTRSGDRLGGISFQGVSPSGSLAEGALIIADADAAWGSSAYNTRLRFLVHTGSSLADSLILYPNLSAVFAGAISTVGSILSTAATSGIGYATGAGGSVTQATSRTTGVTINKVCGEITIFAAAGSTTATSFTVTNSAMAATDQVHLCCKSGTNKYLTFVTAKAAGSFEITFQTTGGTSSDAPVFSFEIIKAVAA